MALIDEKRPRKAPALGATVRYTSLALASFALLSANTANASRPRTVTTQDRSGAVILWDATPEISRYAADGTPTREALRSLESEALGIFIGNAPQLSRTQHHLRVVVSFAQTGVTDPRYQTKTFGIKTFLTVEGNISSRTRYPRNWADQLKHGITPPSIKIELARDLPTYNQ